jgi:DNA-binding NtrC family response regulator
MTKDPLPGAHLAGRPDSTVYQARRAALRPLPIELRVSGARARPNPLRLGQGVCTIGAGEGSDLMIESDSVSRRHAEVSLVPEGVRVVDLGSKNGLFYLGNRFQSMTLHPGSRFRVGPVEFEISVDEQVLASMPGEEPDHYADMLGVSPSMRKLFGQLARLEGSKVNLLVCGESGTGKELVARAVHEHSPVRQGPLVVVNCGALDRQLVRSELFGHRRGAFTGATHNHVGAFEAASGGSLFLDEIGELPLDVQPVLLRALELGRIAPVGSHEERAIDVRLIAATHRDLLSEVQAGTFREDLFYRVQVVRLDVPPLRARLEDVPVLAQAFARRQGLPSLPEDVVEALMRHHWPGNVRELRNAVEAYAALGTLPRAGAANADTIDAALNEFVDPSREYAAQKAELLQRFTRAYLRRLLESTQGNQSEAARLSGLERSYLGKLLSKLGLPPG